MTEPERDYDADLKLCEALPAGEWLVGNGTPQTQYHGPYAVVSSWTDGQTCIILEANHHFDWNADVCRFVVAARERWPATIKRLQELEGRCCAICNDTGHLQDSQAWDCGQPDSDCPYCPETVDEARTWLKRLQEENKRLLADNAELRRAANNWGIFGLD